MAVVPADRQAIIGGLTFHYLDWGTEGKLPLLCLHGFAQTAHSWDEVAPALRGQYHVFAMDQRGHGDSEWVPDGDYSHESHYRDIVGLVDVLKIDTFVLAGLSMGGLNALTYTARHPEKVRALIVVDVSPEVERAGVENIRNFVSATDELDSFEEFVERACRFNPRRSVENIRQRLTHNLRQLPSGKWTWKYDKRLRNFRIDVSSLWESVGRIGCPTLILRGEESDVLSTAGAEKLRQAIPHSQKAVIPRAGHSVMGDNPAAFTDAVQSFLRSKGL